MLGWAILFDFMWAAVTAWALTGSGLQPSDCPRLQDPLRQIAAAPDPAAFAHERGISLIDGRVRVVVELIPGAALPLDVPLVVEGQYERLVQVLVPPAELCALAADPAVAIVRLPYPRAADRSPPAADPGGSVE
jgi:hypothetical protein